MSSDFQVFYFEYYCRLSCYHWEIFAKPSKIRKFASIEVDIDIKGNKTVDQAESPHILIYAYTSKRY